MMLAIGGAVVGGGVGLVVGEYGQGDQLPTCDPGPGGAVGRTIDSGNLTVTVGYDEADHLTYWKSDLQDRDWIFTTRAVDHGWRLEATCYPWGQRDDVLWGGA